MIQVWINQGDIVLLSLRDFQDNKADVIVKYTADEARNRTYQPPSSCAHPLTSSLAHQSRHTANFPKTPRSTRRTPSARKRESAHSSSERTGRSTSTISNSSNRIDAHREDVPHRSWKKLSSQHDFYDHHHHHILRSPTAHRRHGLDTHAFSLICQLSRCTAIVPIVTIAV